MPLGTQVLNFQICFFSQYVVAFCLGIWLSRRDGLLAIASDPLAKRLGLAACVLGPVGLVAILLASMPVPKVGPPHLAGGMNGPAIAFALWEQSAGACFALGIMYLFARKTNRPSRVATWLADRSFAVYMLHAPVLVLLTLWMQPYRTSPIPMMLILTFLGLVASFVVADLARRVPLLRSIL
jgi:peptidoglycan/LPS O-acetylase OafA/YrhL